MSRYRNSLQEVFEAYGDDARAALDAFANIDPEGWSEFVDGAAEAKYLAAYRSHRRSLIESVRKDALADDAGQARLFEVPATEERVELRRRIVLDGEEYDLGSLEGHAGAAIARKVAERDLAPSLTTVNRCRFTLRLADHVDEETERLGRPVTFAEVLGVGGVSVLSDREAGILMAGALVTHFGHLPDELPEQGDHFYYWLKDACPVLCEALVEKAITDEVKAVLDEKVRAGECVADPDGKTYRLAAS